MWPIHLLQFIHKGKRSPCNGSKQPYIFCSFSIQTVVLNYLFNVVLATVSSSVLSPRFWCFSMFSHVYLCLWHFADTLTSLVSFKKHASMWTKLALGLNNSVNVCVWCLQWTCILSVCSHLAPSVPRVVSETTTTTEDE